MNIPEGSQGPQKSQNAKDTQDLSSACRCHGDNNVNDRYKDQDSIQDIPAALQIGVLPREKAKSYHLQPGEKKHLNLHPDHNYVMFWSLPGLTKGHEMKI